MLKGVSERIAVAKIDIGNNETLSIIQVYAPTSVATLEEKESFYDELEEVYLAEKSNFTIVMGDLNAKIGAGVAKSCLGNFAGEDSNENGLMAINFLERGNLKVASSFFRKKAKSRWTWQAPNGVTRNEIDHLCIDDIRVVENVETISIARFNSDHRSIINEVFGDGGAVRRRRFHRSRSILIINRSKLHVEE